MSTSTATPGTLLVPLMPAIKNFLIGYIEPVD